MIVSHTPVATTPRIHLISAALRRSQWLIALFIGVISISSHVQAQTSERANQEISGLLSFVERSDCLFVRNGSEYPGPEARAHLEKKLNYLEGKKLIASAEDFIERAASKSSVSGSVYKVKCPTGEQLASAWLTTELQRQRRAP